MPLTMTRPLRRQHGVYGAGEFAVQGLGQAVRASLAVGQHPARGGQIATWRLPARQGLQGGFGRRHLTL